MFKTEHINEKLYGSKTRQDILLILNSKSLDEKIQITRKAIMARNIIPYHLNQQHQKCHKNVLSFDKLNLINICIEGFDIGQQKGKYCWGCQTEDQWKLQETYSQTEQLVEGDKIQEKLSLSVNECQQQNTVENSILQQQQNACDQKSKITYDSTTIESISILNDSQLQFQNQIQVLKLKVLELEQQKKRKCVKQIEIEQLKNKIKQLKEELKECYQQENKWKKAMEEYQMEIQNINKEFLLFQKQYDLIRNKEIL